MPSRNISRKTFNSMTQKSENALLPILIDIKHPGIKWDDESQTTYKQTDGHLRLISNSRGVMYKGNDITPKWYAPCEFSFKRPKEDGKTKSKASISISCIDSRLIEVIRLIKEDLTCSIVALYTVVESENETEQYIFSKIYGKDFELGSVSWDGITAQWELDPDSTMDLSVPRDKGSSFRIPSVVES